jgi:hypothetical protein
MSSVARVFAVLALAGLAACAASAPPAVKPAPATTVPARAPEPVVARAAPAAAPQSPALAAFLADARKMGLTYETPPGYTEVPVRSNQDQSYDYAIASADKQIEMRFTLRPYDKMPPPMRNRQMSFMFFMTGISNLVRGGHEGQFVDPEPVPREHFNADDARLVVLRWSLPKKSPDAFGDGYEVGTAIFIHRKGVGDAYTFALFKDRDATAGMDEDKLHAMRFAPR